MPLHVTRASGRALERLPIPARPRVDPADVRAPEGYAVEAVMVGLNFPNGLAFDEAGTLYVCEGGVTLLRRPFLGSRVLALEPSGRVTVVVEEYEAPLMGIDVRDGHVYAGLNSRPTRIVRYSLDSGRRETLVEIPSGGGTHPVNGPRFGPDGEMYFGQGAASINGVMGVQDFVNGTLFKHPTVHDVPGQDVTLAGENFDTPDPRAPVPLSATTGAFKPFGTPSERGEVVAGETKCTTGVFRSAPDGGDVELLAWGVREGFGFAFNERGELWVGDNNMTDGSTRPVANDPDRVWRVRAAEPGRRGGATPPWHGFPDVCADGVGVGDPSKKPLTGPQPQPLIEDQPEYAGKAPVLLPPHSGVAKLDFSPGGAFGHRGDLFVCLVGSLVPLTTPREEMGAHGFEVARVDTATGEAHAFLRNAPPGPARSTGPHGGGSAGMERPVDCRFSPDGESLYVLDVGRVDTGTVGLGEWGRTGVLWRVSPEDLTR